MPVSVRTCDAFVGIGEERREVEVGNVWMNFSVTHTVKLRIERRRGTGVKYMHRTWRRESRVRSETSQTLPIMAGATS